MGPLQCFLSCKFRFLVLMLIIDLQQMSAQHTQFYLDQKVRNYQVTNVETSTDKS